MAARGVIVASALLLLPMLAAVPAGALTLKSLDGLDHRILARAVAAGELPLDLLFLPSSLRGALDINLEALQGVDAITQTHLPGPQDPLLPGSDNGALAALLRASGTLPSLPTEDLEGLLAAPPGAAPDAHRLQSLAAATSAVRDVTGAVTETAAPLVPLVQPAGSSSPSTQGTPSSTPTGDGVVQRVTRTWEELPAEQKAAATAGAFGFLLLAPFAMYSRIRRDQALKNPTRKKVYDLVCGAPGQCIKDIATGAGVSYSTASYHLDRLVKDAYIVATDEGNRVAYYKNGGQIGPQDRQLIPILKNAEAMKVLEAVMGNPWCYRAQVAAMLGVSHTTVNWHLKRLVEAGLVHEHRKGRACHLVVPDDAVSRLDAVLSKVDGVIEDVAAPTPMAATA